MNKLKTLYAKFRSLPGYAQDVSFVALGAALAGIAVLIF